MNPIPKIALIGLYDPIEENELADLPVPSQGIERQAVAMPMYHSDIEVHNKFMTFMFRDGWSEESFRTAIKEADEGNGCLAAWWPGISTNIEGYVAYREYLDTAHEFLDVPLP